MIAVGLVVFLAVVVCAASAATPPAVPMVFAEGDSYTIGSTIVSCTCAPNSCGAHYDTSCHLSSPQGAAFKTQILTALRNDTFYNTIMLPYYRTPKGAALYESMFANAKSSFPQYVDELQGMADAIGITLEEVSKREGWGGGG